MNGLFLLILSWLRPLITRLGADFEQVRAIVALKLTLDNRRTYTAFGNQQQYKQKDRSNSFWLMLLLYSIMGLAGVGMLLTMYRQAPLFALSFSFVLPMLLVGMALISDFSAVLLDSSDNSIILPCPVTSRTLLVARLVHICLYLFMISLATSVASLVFVGIKFGLPMALVYFTFTLLGTLLVVFMTNLLYLLLMRFASEEKLREVITYMQIIVAIFFYAGYQILPRMIETTGQTVTMTIQWWHYLLPPVWLGGAMEAVLSLTFDTTHTVLLFLSILTPFVGLWVTVKYLTPLYSQRIASIDTEARSTSPAVPTSQPTDQAGWLAKWVTGSAVEAAGFSLTWRTMLRDRQFKLRAYPTIGYMIVLFFMFFWRSPSSFSNFQTGGFTTMLPLYFCSLMLSNAINLLWYSDQHKAAWVYAATPLTNPGSVMLGAVKAAVMQFLIPVQLFISAIILYLVGWQALDDVVLTLGINLIVAGLYAIASGYHLPFSVPLNQMTKGANVARTIGTMLLIAILGFAHWGLTKVPYGVLVGIPVSAVGVYILNQTIRRAGWNKFSVD